MTCAVLLHCNRPLKWPRIDHHFTFVHINIGLSYLSLTANTTLSAGAFFIALVALLCEYPAISSPLTLRIWSPNRSPPRAAGEPDLTKHTNTPCKMINKINSALYDITVQ